MRIPIGIMYGILNTISVYSHRNFVYALVKYKIVYRCKILHIRDRICVIQLYIDNYYINIHDRISTYTIYIENAYFKFHIRMLTHIINNYNIYNLNIVPLINIHYSTLTLMEKKYKHHVFFHHHFNSF